MKEKDKNNLPLNLKNIESKIVLIRGHRVLLDEDLAALYGVKLKVLNQAVHRNIVRFPEYFMIHLTEEEYEALRSQFVTLKTYMTSNLKLYLMQFAR